MRIKVNLVLNRETCFEAVHGNGGIDLFILTSELHECQVQIHVPAALPLRKRSLCHDLAPDTKYLVLSGGELLQFLRRPAASHCTEWTVQALFICVQRTRSSCMK